LESAEKTRYILNIPQHSDTTDHRTLPAKEQRISCHRELAKINAIRNVAKPLWVKLPNIGGDGPQSPRWQDNGALPKKDPTEEHPPWQLRGAFFRSKTILGMDVPHERQCV
jgi:hypothetical protein